MAARPAGGPRADWRVYPLPIPGHVNKRHCAAFESGREREIYLGLVEQTARGAAKIEK